jgi:hypothetical protein
VKKKPLISSPACGRSPLFCDLQDWLKEEGGHNGRIAMLKNVRVLFGAALVFATVRMKLLGASPSPKRAGEAALPGKINYLVGKDPKKWRTNVPIFGKVRYEAVYPGRKP